MTQSALVYDLNQISRLVRYIEEDIRDSNLRLVDIHLTALKTMVAELERV